MSSYPHPSSTSAPIPPPRCRAPLQLLPSPPRRSAVLREARHRVRDRGGVGGAENLLVDVLEAVAGVRVDVVGLVGDEDLRARSKAYGAADAAFDARSKAAARDDEPEPQPRSLRDPPYTLDPKMSDWDEQRAAWNRRHPETPPFLNDVKPRVMLVTGSSPKPC
ncbi:hypothetical protein ZWY2020_037646 [Hordeum vulgare]|nr:hypothetical protein ZWY2020_037646 [Hordeum vulgare]